jgi:hypothetical protein
MGKRKQASTGPVANGGTTTTNPPGDLAGTPKRVSRGWTDIGRCHHTIRHLQRKTAPGQFKGLFSMNARANSNDEAKRKTLHVRKAKILKAAMTDPRLNGNDCRVLFNLIEFANSLTGECYPSHETIAQKCGLKASGVRLATYRLRDAGYLQWQTVMRAKGKGKQNFYAFHLPEIDPHHRYEDSGGGDADHRYESSTGQADHRYENGSTTAMGVAPTTAMGIAINLSESEPFRENLSDKTKKAQPISQPEMSSPVSWPDDRLVFFGKNIRICDTTLERWRSVFSSINVDRELYQLDRWAGTKPEQEREEAVRNALTIKDKEAERANKDRAAARQAQAEAKEPPKPEKRI